MGWGRKPLGPWELCRSGSPARGRLHKPPLPKSLFYKPPHGVNCLPAGQRAVRSRLHHPPTSLRFEAFSGEVRKLRACSRDAHGSSAVPSQNLIRADSLPFGQIPWISEQGILNTNRESLSAIKGKKQRLQGKLHKNATRSKCATQCL